VVFTVQKIFSPATLLIYRSTFILFPQKECQACPEATYFINQSDSVKMLRHRSYRIGSFHVYFSMVSTICS